MACRVVLLDEVTASRIAAGEVVERPASAVKELVENAIDAGSRTITVRIDEGGKRLIEVKDDGVGMNQEEAVLAVQRHATSKIASADDLDSISTLGFRGEALPSIASVCRMTLTTKSRGAGAATRLVLNGGSVESVEAVGAPDGTSVLVEDLFYNTPARLKFLKTTGTELSRIVEAVGLLALAYPAIGFRVIHNDQEVVSTPGNGDLVNALAKVWGRDAARKMAPVALDDYDIRVSGMIGTPDASRPGRTHQVFIVNGRPIRNRMLGHALEHAFRDVTPEARYPVACIRLDMDPRTVDVNVHPTKMEVKFTHERDVHGAVSRAVTQALLGHGMMPEIRGPGSPHSFGRPSGPERHPTPDAVTAAVLAFQPQHEMTGHTVSVEPHGPGQDPSLPAIAAETMGEQLRGFRVLGQLNNTYIVAETDGGVAFVDQHVAHERVLYERLTAKRTEHGIPSQRLVMPLTVSFGPAESALLEQRLGEFARAGWDLETFGRTSFVVRAAPALIREGQYEAILRDLVDELVHQSVSRRLIVDRDQVTIAHACRLAVKAGDVLSTEEMTGLLDQLSKTTNPHFCPHGRPAVVALAIGELDRRFKR